MLKTFGDLKFKRFSNRYGGIQAKIFFQNGYGASVIQTPHSYTNGPNEYELAVLCGNENLYSLDFSTPITDDVIGYLSKIQVTRVMKQIQKLPKRKPTK